MQRGARREHRDSLLPNTQILEKKFCGQPEVRKIIILFPASPPDTRIISSPGCA